MPELFIQSPAVFVAVAFAFALMIGSFLNVVIYRLPIMMQREWKEQCEELDDALPDDLPEGKFNLIVPRSRCPSCGKTIKAWQNIPVLSYLLLGSRCANCKKSISVRYPIVEMFTAVVAAYVYGERAQAFHFRHQFLLPLQGRASLPLSKICWRIHSLLRRNNCCRERSCFSGPKSGRTAKLCLT